MTALYARTQTPPHVGSSARVPGCTNLIYVVGERDTLSTKLIEISDHFVKDTIENIILI